MKKAILVRWIAGLFLFAYASKINAQDVIWAKNRNADIQSLKVVTDNLGNSYEYIDSLIRKSDQNGNLVFTKYLNGGIRIQDMEFDPVLAKFYATGIFQGSFTLNGNQFISRGSTDGFLAQLDLNGTVLSATTFGGRRQDQARSLNID